MYKLSYDKQTISYATADEVIKALYTLNTHYKNIAPQIVVIRWDSPISLEIGLGDLHDRSFILIVPQDDSEDCKISFNHNSNASPENSIHYTSSDFTFSCFEYNVFSFDIIFKEIHYILLHDMPSNSLKWYSY